MKSVLIIVPYDEVYPPMNGGMQRCFNIIHQLSKYVELTLIINQRKNDFLKSIVEYPSIATVQVHSTKEHLRDNDGFGLLPVKIQNAFRYRWYKKQMMGSADGLFLQYYPVLRKLLKLYKYDTVILENLASLNAVSIIRRYDPSVRIVYDAHNVDSNLGLIAVEKGAMKKGNLLKINKAESSLHKLVNAIITCSKNDLDDFEKMNNSKLSAAVIPNGVSMVNHFFDQGVHQDKPECILFCGTLWALPNTEGLLWFYNTTWPAVKKSFPQLKLLVVGNGIAPDSLHKLVNDSSILFTGAVADVKPWYNQAAVAIVPILTGSGTRLKILEAMGLGIPVVSTSKGAEGITYTDKKNIIIADNENDFAAYLIALLNTKANRVAIQQAARKLVEEKYDWNVIGKALSNFLEEQ